VSVTEPGAAGSDTDHSFHRSALTQLTIATATSDCSANAEVDECFAKDVIVAVKLFVERAVCRRRRKQGLVSEMRAEALLRLRVMRRLVWLAGCGRGSNAASRCKWMRAGQRQGRTNGNDIPVGWMD
jgi:hypothetical protein